MLQARLATAAVALPFLVWVIFWGPLGLFRAVVVVLTLIGIAEYFRMAFAGRPWMQGVGLAAGALVTFTMAAAGGEGGLTTLGVISVTGAIFGTVMLGLMATLFTPEDPTRTIQDLSLGLLGVVYAGAFLPHFVWLRALEGGGGWILFVLAVSMAGDTAAYFAGRAFGKHKLAPAVSPKKTVEGSVGAVGGNLLAGVVVKLIALPAAGMGEVLFLSFVAGLLGQIGDLCESMLKRSFGAKDSGWLFPGHGGVLDRADSLVFPVVFVYYWVAFLRPSLA